ncbi:axonemal dynein heavy chain, putative, partial [Perkinsus marinus ATCC 50983]
MFKTIRKLKEDPKLDSVCAIAEQIKEELEEFKPYVPVVVGLRNGGMRDRHWKMISDKIGRTVGPTMRPFTLEALLSKGIDRFPEEVAEVGDRAGKEWALERQLEVMKGEWENVYFDVEDEYRSTGTYILKGSEEALNMLDEHIVTVQAMQFSLYKKVFEEEIDAWAEKLMRVSETLDEWLKLQRAWMYLQPIFDSEDIVKQLPSESNRFRSVDQKWRKTMAETHENSKVVEICATEGLLEKFKTANEVLEG